MAIRKYVHSWLFCPECHRQRKVVNGVMRVHRRWNGEEMIHCDGSGKKGELVHANYIAAQ
jgi:hypothetical protein